MDGSGDRWLLLHGTPLTPEVWDGVAAGLTRSGPVSCPDITPAGEARDVPGVLAARVAAEVPEGPGRLHVVGHSFGGQVALDLALLAPQRVASLTLVCSRDTPFPAFAAAAARLRDGGQVDAGAALGRWFTPAELDRGGPVVSYARRCLEQADRRSWAAALDAIARYDRAGRAGSSRPRSPSSRPSSTRCPPRRSCRPWPALPRATLRVLPGAAHMTPFNDPAALARLISAVRARE